jgi:hypothetical protein
MSWIEDDAKRLALIYRDGPEVWRDVKVSLRQAVDDYTKFFSPEEVPEVQYADCHPISANCVRVRTIPPPGKQDVSFEVRFDPDRQIIICREAPVEFSLAVSEGKVVLQEEGKIMSAEDACRRILTPLLAKLPRRPPKNI